jgi:hypothetical protein
MQFNSDLVVKNSKEKPLVEKSNKKKEKKVEAPAPVVKKVKKASKKPAPVAELTTKQVAQGIKDGIIVISGVDFSVAKAYGKNILLERINYK